MKQLSTLVASLACWPGSARRPVFAIRSSTSVWTTALMRCWWRKAAFMSVAFSPKSEVKADTASRSFPFLGAPQFIQDSPTNFFIFPDAEDGPATAYFRIIAVSGGTLYRSDSLTPVNAGDFLTL